MKMNALGRLLLNSRARAFAQDRYLVPVLERLGGRLDGCRVLEIGCGRGVGAGLLLDRLGAASVDALDLDPVMVGKAAARLDGRVSVSLGDMTRLAAGDASYDAVVDFGAMHLEPEWRTAISEVHRVLRPGGRLLFEQLAAPPLRALVPIATGRRNPHALTYRAMLDELRSSGFEILGVRRLWVASLSGTVGDLVGAAVKA